MRKTIQRIFISYLIISIQPEYAVFVLDSLFNIIEMNIFTPYIRIIRDTCVVFLLTLDFCELELIPRDYRHFY